MNQSMQGVFTSFYVVGMRVANYGKSKTMQDVSSITLLFCHVNASQQIQRLLQKIFTAKSLGVSLPQSRILIISNVQIDNSITATLSELVMPDGTFHIKPYCLCGNEVIPMTSSSCSSTWAF